MSVDYQLTYLFLIERLLSPSLLRLTSHHTGYQVYGKFLPHHPSLNTLLSQVPQDLEDLLKIQIQSLEHFLEWLVTEIQRKNKRSLPSCKQLIYL